MSHVEPHGVVDLLRAMVALDTVNAAYSGVPDAEAKLAEYLAFAAAALGLSVRPLAVAGRGHNLLVAYERDVGDPWILFDSHMDTVSTAGMTVDPFGAEIRGGRLWGRGACDTKGSGAAMLWALREYVQGGETPNNVGILYSVDEEFGMSGIRSFIENDYPALGSTVGGVVIGEPTRLEAVAAHNGVYRFHVTTLGVAAHSSNPAGGRSAISAMAKVVSGLESGYIPGLSAEHPLTGKAQCSINVIRGGTAGNIIPDRCKIEVDRRLIPGESLEDVRTSFFNALEDIRRRHPEVEYETEEPLSVPPLTPPPITQGGAPLFEVVAGALAAKGLSPRLTGATYATNGGLLSAAGIQCIVLGPGDIAQAHTKDEWIDLAELDRAVSVYAEIMRGSLAAAAGAIRPQ